MKNGHIRRLSTFGPGRVDAGKVTITMTMEETPLPAEQAQSDGKADISPTSAVGLDSDVARIIRAEVIAAMNHQNRTKSSNDLPSYESSIRQHPNVALDEEGEPIIIRAKAKPLRESCMDHIRGTLGLLAIVIIFTLWMFLMATGLDPMRFSLLALFLLLSVCVFTGLVSIPHLFGLLRLVLELHASGNLKKISS